MNDADRAGFEAEALTLRAQALRLRDAASGHKVEQMQRVLDGINSTCISCHSRYRDFSGQLDLNDAAQWTTSSIEPGGRTASPSKYS